MFHSDSSGFEDQFEKHLIIKFRLYWTDQSYSGDHQRLVEKATAFTKDEVPLEFVEKPKRNVKAALMATHEIFGVPSSQLRIAFYFVHNNVSHQTTTATSCMDCPWCSLNCLSLYSLLKHLKLCHARFAFNFVHSEGNLARIEVSINELFDGSYAGAPNNYLTTPSAGYAFSRSGPVRRTSVTHVQVCRPRRMKPNLAEFTETDEALEMNGAAGCGAGGIDRPYLTGHNRLYHHTMTCLPVHPRELDVDSEEESDPRWLKQKTMMMIDEFTDVNEGEKELMKLWNLHVMRHGFVGDCQTALACEMFVEQQGEQVLVRNLYRNFVVHMCSLYDYGLVSSEAFHRVVQRLHKSLSDSQSAKGIIYSARARHREHWVTSGYLKCEQEQHRKTVEEQDAKKSVKKKTLVDTATKEKSVALMKTSDGMVTTTRSKDSFTKPSLGSLEQKYSNCGASSKRTESNTKTTGSGATTNKRRLDKGKPRYNK